MSSQGQYAYASILSCSDSRVPVEYIFDAGIMELFVVRVAGNVCLADQIGTFEYGLTNVRTPLLVVLGHTQCGAVTAAVQTVLGTGPGFEPNILAVLDGIIPAVHRVREERPGLSGQALIEAVAEENVWLAMEDLFRASIIVRELVRRDIVKAVGAVYELETGAVRWLSDVRVAQAIERSRMTATRV